MKNLAILLLLFFFAFNANSSVYLYGEFQAQRSYDESGSERNADRNLKHDLDGNPLAIGVEYRFANDGSFELGAGISLQNPTSVKPDDNLEKIALTQIYFNVYSKASETVALLLGTQFVIPDIESGDNFENYEARSGFGYRFGVDLKLVKGFRAQWYYRHTVLDTEADNGYEGDLDVSSLMLALGWEF